MPDKHEVGGSSPLGPTNTQACVGKRKEFVELFKYLRELKYLQNLMKN